MRKKRRQPEPAAPEQPRQIVRRRKVSSGPRAPEVKRSDAETKRAQQSLSGFLDHGQKKKRRGKSDHLKPIDALIKDAEIRSTSGEWEGCTGRSFVGLYAFCFRMIYGVVPIELYKSEGLIGIGGKNASSILRNRFGGDTSKMVEFMKWTWAREKGRDEWARRNKIDRKQLGLRVQFSESLVQDYQINMGRRRGGK